MGLVKDQFRSPSLLSSWAGHERCKEYNGTRFWDSTPGLSSPTAQPCTCSAWQLPLGDQGDKAGGGGAGARSFGPRPALFSGFQGEGKHTPEWDLKLMSKSLSKGSFQPALSIVSLTARCRPPLTPPCVMGRGTGSPPQEGNNQHKKVYRPVGGSLHTVSPKREGRVSVGAM